MDKNSIHQKADKFKIDIRKKEYNKKFSFRRKKILQRMTKGTEKLKEEVNNYKIFFSKKEKELEKDINKGDYSKIRVILQKIRVSVSSTQEMIPYEEFYNTKLINYMFTILEQGEYFNQVVLNTEIFWIISNLASAPPEYNKFLIKNKLLDIYKYYLKSDETDYIEYIVWAMSNFIDDGEILKMIYDKKIFDILFDCFKKFEQIREIRYTFSWFFSNCLRRSIYLPNKIVDKIIESFRIFLHPDEPENVLIEVLWGLSFYLETSENQNLESGVSKLVNLGFFPLISGYLKTENKSILRPLLNILGRTTYLGAEYIKLFYNEEFKYCIIKCLDESISVYKYDTIWVLRNILVDNEKYFEDFLNCKQFIYKIVEIIKNDPSSNCRVSALDLLFAIFQFFPGRNENNINTFDNFQDLKYFLKDYLLLDLLMDNFELKNKKMILKSLLILEWLLKYETEISDTHDILLYIKNHNKFEILVEVQNLKDNQIYKKSNSLLKRYFSLI